MEGFPYEQLEPETETEREIPGARHRLTAPGAPLPGQRLSQATGKLLRRVNGTLELPPGY